MKIICLLLIAASAIALVRSKSIARDLSSLLNRDLAMEQRVLGADGSPDGNPFSPMNGCKDPKCFEAKYDAYMWGVAKFLAKTFDANHDGKLNHEEWSVFLDGLAHEVGKGFPSLDDKKKAVLFGKADSNGDGSIQLGELHGVAYHICGKWPQICCPDDEYDAHMQGVAKFIGGKFDANKNGELDSGEWSTFMDGLIARLNQLGEKVEPLPKSEKTHWLDEADSNGNGSIQPVELHAAAYHLCLAWPQVCFPEDGPKGEKGPKSR